MNSIEPLMGTRNTTSVLIVILITDTAAADAIKHIAGDKRVFLWNDHNEINLTAVDIVDDRGGR